jgi:hypothetical protein
MGYSLRIFFIDKNDKIKKIPLTRFDRIRARDPEEKLDEYKNTRIRYAEIVVELENRKPVFMARAVFGYLYFDANGLLDEKILDDKWEIMCNILSSSSSSNNLSKIIYANDRFGERRFKNKYKWIPSPELEKEIFDKIFE